MAGNPRTGFNGDTAWQEEHGEVKELTVYPKRDADFYLPLKLRELFPRIELKGKEKLGAREVYRLEAPRLGNPIRRRALARSATTRWSPAIAKCWRSAKILWPIAALPSRSLSRFWAQCPL
jgi:hypothetical protein